MEYSPKHSSHMELGCWPKYMNRTFVIFKFHEILPIVTCREFKMIKKINGVIILLPSKCHNIRDCRKDYYRWIMGTIWSFLLHLPPTWHGLLSSVVRSACPLQKHRLSPCPLLCHLTPHTDMSTHTRTHTNLHLPTPTLLHQLSVVGAASERCVRSSFLHHL